MLLYNASGPRCLLKSRSMTAPEKAFWPFPRSVKYGPFLETHCDFLEEFQEGTDIWGDILNHLSSILDWIAFDNWFIVSFKLNTNFIEFQIFPTSSLWMSPGRIYITGSGIIPLDIRGTPLKVTHRILNFNKWS